MKTFNTTEEAKKYGENFGKYDHETVEINGKKHILCGTNCAYEDSFYDFALEMSEKFHTAVDEAVIRDALIKAFEKACDVKFLDVCDEY